MNLNESLASARKKYGGSVGVEMINDLAAIDPTPTKKYVEFLCKLFLDARGETEGDADEIFSGIPELIGEFEGLVRSHLLTGSDADVNRYATKEELEAAVKEGRRRAMATKKARKETAKADLTLVGEFSGPDGKATVYAPQNYAASRAFGADTDWCISRMNGRHHWLRYKLKGYKVYFVVVTHANDSVSEKFAVLSKEGEPLVIYDSEDVEYSVDELSAMDCDLSLFGIDLDRVFQPPTHEGEERFDEFFVDGKFDVSTLVQPHEESTPTEECISYDGDGKVNIDKADVYLTDLPEPLMRRYLKAGPVRFGKVLGSFSMYNLPGVTTLEGLVPESTRRLDVSGLDIEDLRGCPPAQAIAINYCSLLTSLKGCPEKLDYLSILGCRALRSLAGGPRFVRLGLSLTNCGIETLDGFPERVGVNSDSYISIVATPLNSDCYLHDSARRKWELYRDESVTGRASMVGVKS